MRTLVNHGLVLACLATMMACGGEDKPAQDPSMMSTPSPPPTQMPESRPATTDAKPVESAMGGGTNAGTETMTTPVKPAEKALTDAEIVAVTSTANKGEIEMAEIATKNATNPEVKNFAAMMITQHRDMESKGKALATKAKITPADSEASARLKSNVDTTVSALKTQKGKEFDKAYMESQVKAHRDVLDVFDTKLLPSAQHGELKTLLADGRAHVATHLAKAQEIQSKLETGAATTPTKEPAKPAPKK